MTTWSLLKTDKVAPGDVTTTAPISHQLVLGLGHHELTQDSVNSAFLSLDALSGYAWPLYLFPTYSSLFPFTEVKSRFYSRKPVKALVL